MIYDDTICLLGEGPLWHPERGQLFWFDILGKRMHSRIDGATRTWRFADHCSAAGWVSRTELLVASERELVLLDLETGRSEPLVELEADNPLTRSNDGRADPHGGFWIGTMGKKSEEKAGSIWRYYRGELRRIVPEVTITNAICFAPDGRTAYWTDTKVGRIMAQRLAEADGWPTGEPELFLDLSDGFHPDGAVVDSEGRFWNAQWGQGEVVGWDTSGRIVERIAFPARQTTCPAFGGEGLTTLFCTSAAVGIAQPEIADAPQQGQTFAAETGYRGQAEHRVILG